MMSDNKVTYHEVDFLLPAQRFNIQFSYVSQRGLPFIREFVLRLVHVAPMSKAQISTYFGLSRRETDEAISDLVQRGELTLSPEGRLTLTEKSNGYFSQIGEIPQLSAVQDSGVNLSFDLATFSCFSNQDVQDKWKTGISLKIDDNNASQSERLVEKHFQRQFNQILDKGYLSQLLAQDGKEQPTVYTVNSVNKLRQLPLRLATEFQMDNDGKAVEREDYEELNSSECVHELIAIELSRLTTSNNTMSIFKSMVSLSDEETLKLFDSRTNLINPKYVEDMQALEEHADSGRTTFLGPIYSKSNWEKLQKALAPLINKRIKSKVDTGVSRFIWIAPSDPYWAKNGRFSSSLSDFIRRSSTKEKKLYDPILYVPVSDDKDFRVARQWKHELGQFHDHARGLAEGFLDGNVEILLLEDEVAVVIYHFTQPETLPVTMPLGFITKNKKLVTKLGKLVNDYVKGSSAFDKPNDCGAISSIAKGSKWRGVT
ncbi:conserved hypothetical protein [Hahella chejuensis KCTC 2396]|uniref:Uncharacterized protein n=1 Tax=Hahella chejuensis (strain KCTC 2396) TaxID=349521 RepID=Q2S6S2_HAHCH|nr:hypothetical protein [Hahella chejuensis]ABC33652.1 conserved hypothetical protein [Hahella chejuensis KCTC 2396]